MTTVIGLDSGATTVRDAEHVLHELLKEWGGPVRAQPAGAGKAQGGLGDLVACTHLIREATNPHVALSIAGDVDVDALPDAFGVAWQGGHRGPAMLVGGAAAALAEHEDRMGGRAVEYPGRLLLAGSIPVWKILAGSAIDEIVVIGGPLCAPDTVVHTRDFVRPEWRTGKLVLVTTPAAYGGIAPFEIPNPSGCYCDH